MIVAFFHPHNEGSEAGIITGPGYTTDTRLSDTYEVDAEIASFETEAEARDWLVSVADEATVSTLIECEGGYWSSQQD